MRLAIVGSQEKSWPTSLILPVRTLIATAITLLEPTEVVSGRCPEGGVDVWAEDEATLRDINFVPFPPRGNTWEFYKARNKLIAERCDQLIAIRSVESKTYGSGWTADYAEQLCKRVWRFEL